MPDRSDNFNRGNGPIGSPSDGGSAWVNILGVTSTIVSNKAKGRAVLESGALNVQVSLRGDYGPESRQGIILRYIDDNNYILIFKPAGGSMTIQQWVGGVNSTIGTGASPAPDPYFLSATIEGTTVKAFVAGVERASGTTTLTTGTKHGFAIYNSSNPSVDDFSIVDLGGGSTPKTGLLLRRRRMAAA